MVLKLYVFDFDDTLVSSEAMVRVIHDDGTSEKLASHEFATYVPLPGDDFDFNDFEIYPPNGKILSNMFNKMQAAIQQHGPEHVIVLSARGNDAVMREFLQDNGLMHDIEIVGVASSDPQAKGRFVRDKVLATGYNEVYVFDDSKANVQAIGQAMKKIDGVQYFGTLVETKQESMLRKTIRGIIKEIFC